MQPTIDVYCYQHSRALQCAQRVSELIDSDMEIKDKSHQIRLSLAELAGILKPHFSSEDSLLYPSLMRMPEPSVATTAKKFWDEMGGITEAVNHFLERWRKAGEIENNQERFASDCKMIFIGLKNRIEAEEKELYPLFLTHMKV